MIVLAFALVGALAQSTQSAKPATDQPEFFDKPQFVVSGVADYTYRGGHGSDSVLRSTESLTKAATSLSDASTVDSMPLADAAARAKLFRDKLTREPNSADLHHELADIEERLGHPVEAVHEYQRAAELQPSEKNLFDWGAELLKHRAGAPAVEVFTRGASLFPDSLRFQLGLGAAYYLTSQYEQAAQHFFAATDLRPNDPTPYLFLGQIRAKEISDTPGYLERLERFAKVAPNNALANYYYAACLWDRRSNVDRVRMLAQRAAERDPKLALAYLLLGAVDAEEKNLPNAIAMFQKAIEVSPDLEEAHYRLAQAYELSGETLKSQQERAIYKDLSSKSAAQAERERKNLQQFIFALKEEKRPSEK